MHTDYARTLIGRLLLLFVIAVGVGANVAHAEEAKPEELVYKKTSDSKDKPVELKLHIFKPEGWKAGDKRPCIVFFFGGGWVGGNPNQFFPHSRELAERGMVAISAEYRVFKKHGTPPQACVEDGKSAIRYVRANAAKLGIDPDRIVSAGGSAGGHVAACTGVLDGFVAEGEDKAISSLPSLMVLFNPVIDTSRQTGYGAKRVGDDPESLSPLHHVKKGQPPCMIVHGDADKVVSIDSVRRFTKRSKEIGAKCTLHEYEGAGHGFFNHSSFRKPKGDADYYRLTMDNVLSCLAKHGYVTGGRE